VGLEDKVPPGATVEYEVFESFKLLHHTHTHTHRSTNTHTKPQGHRERERERRTCTHKHTHQKSVKCVCAFVGRAQGLEFFSCDC